MVSEQQPFDQRRIEAHIARVEANAFARYAVGIFRANLAGFLSGEKDSIDLFKADYVPAEGVTRFRVLDTKYFLEEIRLVRKFTEIISRHVLSDVPEIGVAAVTPRAETNGLRQFIAENPDAKILLLNLSYEVGNPFEGVENIYCKKFKDPKTGRLISCVWTAVRYSPQSDAGPKEAGRRIKISTMSHVANLKPVSVASRVK